MSKSPKISVAIPTSEMGGKGSAYFLTRSLKKLAEQTFTDFEVVITDDSRNQILEDIANRFPFTRYHWNKTQLKMAGNTNEVIKRSQGEIVKLLYLDDYLTHENSLQVIADSFKGGWLATGCLHDDGSLNYPHFASWDGVPPMGVNPIGSPSVVAFINDKPLFFDEHMTWLLDYDLYKRLFEKYGSPTIINDLNVTIGLGVHQMTHILTDQEKLSEYAYLNKKYGN